MKCQLVCGRGFARATHPGPVLADGLGAYAGLLAGMAGCRLAWWASSGAIGEPGTAG